MTHQLNIILLSLGIAQGGILSLWFLRNKRTQIANIWFAAFLIAVGIQLTLKVITKVWMMENVLTLYFISYKTPYLIGPLLFLYCKARRRNSFEAINLLHFVPFFVFISPDVFLQMTFMPNALIWHPYVHAGIQLTSLSIYAGLALRLNDQRVRKLIILVWVCELIIVCAFAAMYVFYPRFPDVRLLFVVLTGLIYWISYIVVSQPDLLILKEETPVVALGVQRVNKYSHSSLKETEANRIEAMLRKLMESDKVYLNPDLSIDLLAQQIETTRHHLSQVLNEKMGQTYGDYVANFRLEEARRRLTDPSNNRYTIAAIALDSGFNSLSSFNDSFKKKFHQTPSQFRQSQIKKMSA